jgi:hypothetical protein
VTARRRASASRALRMCDTSAGWRGLGGRLASLGLPMMSFTKRRGYCMQGGLCNSNSVTCMRT